TKHVTYHILYLPKDRIQDATVTGVKTCALPIFGQYSEAEQALKAAIRAIPVSGRAHYYLGELYYNLNRLAEALPEFQKAIELKAEVGLDRIYRKIGSTYSRQIKIDEAVAAYRKALEINP